MTWFQLLDAQRKDSEPQRPATAPRARRRLAPNSALFFNPSLPVETAPRPVSRTARPHLRLVKGARVSSAA